MFITMQEGLQPSLLLENDFLKLILIFSNVLN